MIDEARSLLSKRIEELDDERHKLEKALRELGAGVGRRATARRSPTPKQSTKPRRRRKGGTRGDQAVKLIEKSPGITASEIAKSMKIKPNYLYRVLGELEKDGRVKKSGRKYNPA